MSRKQDSGGFGALLALGAIIVFLSLTSVESHSGEIHTQVAPACDLVTAERLVGDTHTDAPNAQPASFGELLCDLSRKSTHRVQASSNADL